MQIDMQNPLQTIFIKGEFLKVNCMKYFINFAQNKMFAEVANFESIRFLDELLRVTSKNIIIMQESCSKTLIKFQKRLSWGERFCAIINIF